MLTRYRISLLFSVGSLAILMLVRPDIFLFTESFQVPVWVWWYIPGGTFFFSSYVAALCLLPAVFIPERFKQALTAAILSWLLAPIPVALAIALNLYRQSANDWQSNPGAPYLYILVVTSASIPILLALRFGVQHVRKLLWKK